MKEFGSAAVGAESDQRLSKIRCMSGLAPSGGTTKSAQCSERAMKGSVLCAAHKAAARLRCVWQVGLGPRCPYPAVKRGLCTIHLLAGAKTG